MLSSVTARWIRTEISARLAAIIFLNGTGGGRAVSWEVAVMGSVATLRDVEVVKLGCCRWVDKRVDCWATWLVVRDGAKEEVQLRIARTASTEGRWTMAIILSLLLVLRSNALK